MSTCHLYSFTPQTPQQAFRAVSSVGAFLKAPSAPACRRQLYHSFAKDSRLWLSAVDHVSCPGLSRRLFGTLSAQIKSLPKFGKPTRITSHLAVDTTKASIPQLLSRRLSISSQCRNAATGAAPKSPHDDVTKIFGKGVEKDLAIEILSKVQKQRRQGTLDQTLDYQPELLDKALKYLRARYPLDEEAAIIARLDRELDGEWNLPQKNPNKSRSGRSGLQEIREINKQKYEAKKEKEAQQARLEQTQNVENSRPAEAQLVSRKQKEVVGDDGMVRRPGHRPMPAWVARYYDNATARTIPQLTKAQRLIPSAIFTIGAVGIAILFAYAYSPPAADARLFPGVAPAAAAVMGIIALNFLIFVSWKVPPLWKFMNSNFMVIPAIPKAFSMLGAEFSHQQFLHMFSNMLGIWFLGTRSWFLSFTPYTYHLLTSSYSTRRYRTRSILRSRSLRGSCSLFLRAHSQCGQ